ncbi:hypothetical protein FOCC_FOCC005690, partial [Frankliniella occidentalis]
MAETSEGGNNCSDQEIDIGKSAGMETQRDDPPPRTHERHELSPPWLPSLPEQAEVPAGEDADHDGHNSDAGS